MYYKEKMQKKNKVQVITVNKMILTRALRIKVRVTNYC